MLQFGKRRTSQQDLEATAEEERLKVKCRRLAKFWRKCP